MVRAWLGYWASVALVVALLALAVAFVGCRPGRPGQPSGVIDCGIEAVQNNWPSTIGPVNGCLVLPEGQDWRSCLVGLIKPAVGITQDVIACLVRGSGQVFGDAAVRNPEDVASKRAARRADEYTSGMRFAE